MILTRRPWTSQPQVVARVDWSNTLTRGLVFLVNYADPSLRNLATGDSPTLDAALARGAGIRGRTGYATAQPKLASWPGVITTSTGDGLGAFTLLSFSAPVYEANISALLSQCDGNGQPQMYLLANTSVTYSADAGKLTFGAVAALLPTLAGYVDGAWHVYVVSRAGGTSAMHAYNIDGIELYQNATFTSGDGFASTLAASTAIPHGHARTRTSCRRRGTAS
jgi:hypothetical protein